jgi:hypothetical protein
MSRDSTVGIATGYGLNSWEVGDRVPVGSNIFFFSTSSRPVLGPHSVSFGDEAAGACSN